MNRINKSTFGQKNLRSEVGVTKIKQQLIDFIYRKI